MKRLLASALVLSTFSLVAFSGCEEKTKMEDKKTISGPSGSEEVKTTTEVKKTGDEKTGETAKPVEAPK